MDFSYSYHEDVEVFDNRDIVSIIEMIEISDPDEKYQLKSRVFCL